MQLAFSLNVQTKDGTLVLTDHTGKTVTFSKEQTVQKQVAMITLGELCGLPKGQLAAGFGFKTRKSYYDVRNVVLNGVAADLWPKRSGPHTPPKRTKEVEALIIRMRFETELNRDEIAEAVAQMGFKVSARLVGQVLADYGLAKKNG
jgi:hypothetical protein